jgi:integrase
VRVPRSTPRPIPEPVLLQAIHDADEETTLMLLLGAYAGLRRAEIAAVKSDDLEGLTLIVRGKGGVVRRVPVHPTLGGRLARLRGYAFPGRWGGHVTPSYVSDRMERVLPHPYTCHSLRHRFATQVYRSTHDLRAVQELARPFEA